MNFPPEEFGLPTVDGLNLHARRWSPACEPIAVVCIIHGNGEHSGRFLHMAEPLVKAGFAVLILDLRGHGKSDGIRGHSPSYDVLMDDIDRLLEAGARRFPGCSLFLFGHSMGGNLVLNYILRRSPSLAGVIVTAPLLRTTSPTPAWKLTLARIMYSLWPSHQLDNGVDPESKTRDLEMAKALMEDSLGHHLITARLGLDVLRAGEWALEHAAEFGLPLLVMQGTDDRVTSVDANRQFAEQVSGDCTLKLWDGFYHELHNEIERRDVFAYIIEWLKVHLQRE